MAVAPCWVLTCRDQERGREELLGLARATNDLAERGGPEAKVDEVQAGTFTVTTPGVFGSLSAPHHQPAAGCHPGVGTIEKRVLWCARRHAFAHAYLPLTFDHRLVERFDADRSWPT